VSNPSPFVCCYLRVCFPYLKNVDLHVLGNHGRGGKFFFFFAFLMFFGVLKRKDWLVKWGCIDIVNGDGNRCCFCLSRTLTPFMLFLKDSIIWNKLNFFASFYGHSSWREYDYSHTLILGENKRVQLQKRIIYFIDHQNWIYTIKL